MFYFYAHAQSIFNATLKTTHPLFITGVIIAVFFKNNADLVAV